MISPGWLITDAVVVGITIRDSTSSSGRHRPNTYFISLVIQYAEEQVSEWVSDEWVSEWVSECVDSCETAIQKRQHLQTYSHRSVVNVYRAKRIVTSHLSQKKGRAGSK